LVYIFKSYDDARTCERQIYQFQIFLNTLKNSLIAHPSPTTTYTKPSTPSFSFGSYWLNLTVYTALDIKHNTGIKKYARVDFINFL
jgi:hypothetical protein